MRNKVAKRIRKAARMLTVGKPDREYVQYDNGAAGLTKRRPSLRLKLGTTRELYLALKKDWMKGVFKGMNHD